MPRIDPSNLNTALCPSCHKTISDTAAFCKYCGAKTGFSANKSAAAVPKAQQAVQNTVPASEKPSIARVHPVEDDTAAGDVKPASIRSPQPAAASPFEAAPKADSAQTASPFETAPKADSAQTASPFETAPKADSAQTSSPFAAVKKPRRQAVPSAAASEASGKTQSAFSTAPGQQMNSTETAVPHRKTAALKSDTDAFAAAGSAASAPFKAAQAASSVRSKQKPQSEEKEEFTDAFALGLPSWSLEPPNMPVNRRRK